MYEVLTVRKLVVTQGKSLGQVDQMVANGELKYLGNGRYEKRNYLPVNTRGATTGRWQSEYPNNW